MNAWLSIVGIGEDGLDGLGAAARNVLAGAEVIVGGKRHLAMVPEGTAERLAWPSPFHARIDDIEKRRGRQVCVLASGDPSCNGVGTLLARHFSMEELRILPSPSAFSLSCARLGWSLTDTEMLSVHGRPVTVLHPYLQPGARLLILGENGNSPGEIAETLCGRGYEQSRIAVLEHLCGERERIVESTAGEFATKWAAESLAALSTIAIECVANPGAMLLGRAPGLPDDAFRHDGQLTKQTVRAATLSRLIPVPGQLLWDVGAGCGSIGIEWMRAARDARAVAIERNPTRLGMVAENAQALGTPGLEVIAGAAPEALAGLPRPDAIFIGGGITGQGLFDACLQALTPGGRLVANAVTLEGERVLVDRHASLGGELQRIAVSHASAVGAYRGFKPAMTVVQLALRM